MLVDWLSRVRYNTVWDARSMVYPIQNIPIQNNGDTNQVKVFCYLEDARHGIERTEALPSLALELRPWNAI